jgi:diaminohydroxyphosphoribosylaminopyrimidine deaminase/5-amino-6-(5-phosphoribosylamino)uracil reductase
VVIGVPDSNAINGGKGTAALRSSGIQVETGLCALQISSMLAPYSKWAGRGIPHVALKLATSLDGRIADYRYASKWITGDVSRSRVRRMREAADAVMVGAATALHDDPGLEDGSPDKGRLLRVIVDSSGSLPLSSRVLNSESPASTIIVTTARCKPERIEVYRGRGARVWQMPSFQGHVCLKSLMARLGEEGVHSVLCEGGGRLAGSLMSGGFVDEYVFFIAPIILGGGGSMASVAGVGKTLADAWRLKYVLQRSVGSDLLVVAVPAAVHDERVSFMAHVLSEQEDCSCLPD